MTTASFLKPHSVDVMKPNRTQKPISRTNRRYPIRGQRRLRFSKRKTQNRKPKKSKHESTTHLQ